MVLAEEDRVREQTQPDNQIIRTDNLRRVFHTKKKGTVHAVRGVSWAAERGQVFGLLGTNGAGKTTTFKMMCGITLPSEGEVHINGVNMATQKHEGRRMIGYCPQFDCLWPNLTVYETLRIYAALRGFTGEEMKNAIDQQMVGMQLEEYRNRRAGTLSGGNKRKLSVAIALMGQPPVVFLDEPSTGMDPVARRFMWTVIQDLADSNKDVVVVLTTHSMDEAQSLCERIAIQVDGAFRCLGTAQQIKDLHGSGYELTLRFAPPAAGTDKDAYMQKKTNTFKTFLADFVKKHGAQEKDALKSAEVTSLNASFMLEIPTSSVATLMRELKVMCERENVVDWYVAQNTLERVFNDFAKTSENAGVSDDT